MSQSKIGLPADGPGKSVGASSYRNSGGDLVYVEWQDCPPVSPQRAYFSGTVSANGISTFQTSPIPSGKTGKLWKVMCSAALPADFAIQESGAGSPFGVLQLNGRAPDAYIPAHKDFDVISGDGAKMFEVVVSNPMTDGNPVSVTVYYDVVQES